MNDSTPPSGYAPQPQKASKASIFFTLLILWFIIFWIADIAGCDWTKPENVQQLGQGTTAITKAEWMQKVRPFYNPGGGIQVTTIAGFKGLVGEPRSTQSAMGEEYWYYECSDGTIQLKIIDPNMSGGRLLIQGISSY